MKRILSFVLSLVITVTAVVYTNFPSTQTVQAANVGEAVTSNGYTYIEEPGYMQYDAKDPNQILVYTTEHITGYAPVDSSYYDMTSCCTAKGAISGTGYVNGRFNFVSGNNNTTGISYSVVKRSDDTQANGNLANTEEEAFMKNWGITRMLCVQTNAQSGILTSASEAYYYWNLRCHFNSALDLSKMTHIYMDFWVSGNYEKSVDGTLNVALWDDNSGSNVDGIEFNIPFHQLKLDNGNPRTGHTYRLDLRNFGASYGTTYLNSLNGVTLRYMSSKTSTQFATGMSPKIFIGKMIAYCISDNIQTYGNFDNTSDPGQGAMFTYTGNNRWNKNMNINFPVWNGDAAQRAIVGLIVGDRTTAHDYYFGALDRSAWRYTCAASSITFPSSPVYASGGGNQSLTLTRNKSTKYVTAHAYTRQTIS